MSKTTLERVLHYLGDDGEMTRYEIFSNGGQPTDNIEYVLVYREKDIDGQKLWVRTNDQISLDHLSLQRSQGFPTMVMDSMRSPSGRQISSVVDECNKHWSKHYA